MPMFNVFGCRSRWSAILLATLFFPLTGFSASPQFRPDRLLIIPKAGREAAVAQLNAAEKVTVRRTYPDLGHICVLQLPVGADAPTLVEKYRHSGHVDCAELDSYVELAATPNDPSFQDGSQWALNNFGQISGFLPDADIDAPEAWDMRTSATNIIVAVIDSGARLTHQDLAANLWVNPREIPGNSLDDDGNGYIDDVHGIDATQSGASSGNPLDNFGHGTHVAGIIGAEGNNGVGAAGVFWRGRMMICRFLDNTGNGSFSDAVECFSYARSNGAKIINASFVTSIVSGPLASAVNACRQAGIIIVAAAGNSGGNNDATPIYPASFVASNIVAVAATDAADRLWGSSNYGSSSVDLAAPGVNIFAPWQSSDSAYFTQSGTSMAAAVTSGALALIWAEYPDEPYWKIIERLLAAVDPLPTLTGRCVTGGRLNLRHAFARPSLAIRKMDSPLTHQVELRGSPGRTYTLEASSDFVSWTPLATNAAPSGGLLTFSAAGGEGIPRVYRAVLQP